VTLKEFDYYLENGIAKKVTSNKQRAEFLIAESKNSMDGLNERVKIIGINSKNANSIIKDCYDVLIELIRAKMFIDGFSASGNNAHESEVSYLKKLKIEKNKIYFMDELRHFRNSATYYGKILGVEFAEKVFKFTVKMQKELLSVLN
jgi:hypothetical protein